MIANSSAGGAALPERPLVLSYEPAREEHDRILSGLSHPRFLVGDGSLLDDVWPIRTDDPEDWIGTDPTLNFCVPVAPGPVLLTDPANVHDLLTAKLYVYHSFHEGLATAAEVMRLGLVSLLTMIRWRVVQGLPRMSDLSRPWFDLFVEQVSQRGRWGLLPYKQRIDEYLTEIRAGCEVLPIETKWKKPVLAGTEVARRLGVSTPHQIPKAEWRRILDCLATVNPRAYRNTVRYRTTEATLPKLDYDAGNGLTSTAVSLILQPFDRLWVLRNHLAHDVIGFRAFDHATTCQSVANSIASKMLERTSLPPAHQVCWLVDASLRFIFASEAHLRRMQEVVKEAFRRYPNDRSAASSERIRTSKRREAFLRRRLGPLLRALEKSLNRSATDHPPFLPIYLRQKGVGTRKEGLAVRDLLFVLLPAACSVIIAALTARRNKEIASLRYDCLIEDEYGDQYLSVWIEKTIRQLDKIPVPASVVHAVNILKWLSEEAREERGIPWLFSLKDPGPGGEVVAFQMSKALKTFAAFVRVPPLPDGSEWDWRPHQFRVFFGVVYFWHFDHPSLTALSDFYKHFNPTMTRAYVTRVVQGSLLRLLDEKSAARKHRGARSGVGNDEAMRAVHSARERARDFMECREAFLLEVARGAATQAAPLAGWGGEAWNRELEALVDKVSPSVHLVPAAGELDATLDAMLRDWVKGKHLDPHPAGHGFCKCGPDHSDLAAAACLAVKKEQEGEHFDLATSTGPDYAYAADETCLGCPHNVQRRVANERYWIGKLAEAEFAAETAATTALRQRAERRAARLRNHIRRCFVGDGSAAHE